LGTDCVQNIRLPLDTDLAKWFYRYVTALNISSIVSSNSTSLRAMKVTRKAKKATFKKAIEEPVVKDGFKGLLGALTQFVAVGGDFI